MGVQYPEPLAAIDRNMIHTERGNVSANYLLEGINFSSNIPEQVAAAQRAHEALYKELSAFGLDFSLYGLKARTSSDELLRKMSAGVEHLASDPNLAPFLQDLNAFATQLETGARKEFHRVYWLSVHLPHDETAMSKMFDSIAEREDLTEEDLSDFGSLEDRIFKSIPTGFAPRRLNSDHVAWAYDRARLRGLEVPVFPEVHPKPTRAINLQNFPTTYFTKNADGTALMDGFAELFSAGNAKLARRAFLSNFFTANYALTMSVANFGGRRASTPNGAISYQTFATVTSAPRIPEVNVARFTSIVDQFLNVDADFVQHVSFNPAARGKKYFRSLRTKVSSENEALSTDDLDVEEYQEKGGEIEQFRRDVQASGGVPMRVSTTFCFAHANLEVLEKSVHDLVNLFEDNDFVLERVPAAQFDAYCQMLPGIPPSEVTQSTKLDTTAYRLSAAASIRQNVVGDATGVPIAINKENALGQVVYLNVLTATDSGNASIAVTGAQGSGKTHFMKLVFSYLHDLGKYVHVLDPSPHGEYEVFARSLDEDVTVVDLAEGRYSVDPLKLYDDPEIAKMEFLDVMLPLLDVNPKSKAASILSNMLDAGYRSAHGINSTRDLLERMERVAGEDKELRGAYNSLNFYSQQQLSRSLIDPLDASGRVVDLPVLNTTKRIVVFRTGGLKVHKVEQGSDITPRERISQAIFTSVAVYTARRFNEINDVCVLIGDEMHVLKGNARVMDLLVKTPDRMGRKEKNWILAGSQLAEDMDENFALIKKRLVLKQEKNSNARSSLDWIDLLDGDEASESYLVQRLVTDTSPIDPASGRTISGREGEGWFADGHGNVARVRVLNHLLADRERASDTTSSTLIRAEDLI